MKIRIAALLVPVLLALCGGTALASPATNKDGAGTLDPSFGQKGAFAVATPQVVAPNGTVGPGGPTHFAVAPSNKSYAQQGQLIVGFAANGKPDQKFGSHGRVSVVPGPGKVIEVSGVAVDSQNRVLVAGTYEPFPGFKN